MTSFAVIRLGEKRIAAVLVERRVISARRADGLLRRLEERLRLPVMLVARDDSTWVGAQVHAAFDAKPYLYALMQEQEIEWAQLAVVLDED